MWMRVFRTLKRRCNSECPAYKAVLLGRLRPRGIMRIASLVLSLGVACEGLAYETPSNLDLGWDGKVQLGALATFGVTDTVAISGRADVTYRGESLEHEFTAKLYRSANQTFISRHDANGAPIFDSNRLIVKDRVRTTTNDRRFVGIHPRFFFNAKYYVFALADYEVNEPADIKSSSRQVSGVGYKLWKSKKDFISAAIGIGRKKFEQISGESDEGVIGYFGVRIRRSVYENIKLSLDMDSDFGGENRYSEIEMAVKWKVRDPISISFKYEAQFNSNIINPLATFDNDVEAALSVNMVIDVFQ